MSEPLYRRIQQDILDAIASGQLQPGDRLPTEAQLSQQYGVSRITSQRAMADLKLRGLIVRKARAGSFVAETPQLDITSPFADVYDASANGGNGRVAIVAPFDMATPGIYQYLDGIISQTGIHAERLNLLNTHYTEGLDASALARCVENAVSGIIYYPSIGSRLPVDQLIRLRAANFPLVLIDKRLDGLKIACVQTDNQRSMRELAERVLQAGHRNIAYAAEVSVATTPSVRDRYIGFCEALAASDVSHCFKHFQASKNIAEPDKTKQFHREITRALSQWADQGVTAIVCDSDSMALSIRAAYADKHGAQPFPFSLTGFDGISPDSLTSMRQRYIDIGKAAATILNKQINQADFTDHDLRFPADFVDGGTLKPPQK